MPTPDDHADAMPPPRAARRPLGRGPGAAPPRDFAGDGAGVGVGEDASDGVGAEEAGGFAGGADEETAEKRRVENGADDAPQDPGAGTETETTADDAPAAPEGERAAAEPTTDLADVTRASEPAEPQPDEMPGQASAEDHGVAGQDVPGQAALGRIPSGREAVHDAVPGEPADAEDETAASAPAEAVPGEDVPGEAVSGEDVPGEETPAEEAPDDGRFKVVLDNFEGPFDLLLQLISKHKLDVTEVALSKVTDEFIAHIHAMGSDWDLDQTTEFLVVAATLLDLKAARLLPTAEVEDEADLALLEARDLLFARLLQYRAYKEIAAIFAGRLADEARRHPRTVGLEPHHAELLPDVVISIGPEGFAKLAVKAMRPKPKPQVYVEHIHAPLVSVREQAEVVVARLRELGEVTFQQLARDAPDTLTVVARFLALLELYRERAVSLEQDEALGELIVRWSGAEGARPVVTDEFDQEPAPPGSESAKVKSAEETSAEEKSAEEQSVEEKLR